MQDLLRIGLYGSGVVGLVNLVKALHIRIEEKQRLGIELSPTQLAEKDFCTSFYRLMALWGAENYAKAVKKRMDELDEMQVEFLREWDGIWRKENNEVTK